MLKLNVLNNERPDVCTPCGGRCCISGPGIAAAADFGSTPQAVGREVRKRLRAGTWKVDKFAGRLWLRPAHIDDKRGAWAVDPPNGTAPCVFLSSSGCRLTFADRPQQCRDTIPKGPGNGCAISHKAFLALIRSWVPFRHILGRAAREMHKQLTEDKQR
jgi:hypothetical protein